MTYHPRKTPREAVLASAAVGADTTVYVRAPHAGVVQAVRYATVTAITGAATNSRTFTLTNLGATGDGTAVAATLAMVSGVDTVAKVFKTIPVTATAADAVVAEGDLLAFTSTHVGTGIADPGGLLSVEFGPVA